MTVWRVEVTTTYYGLVEVEAADEMKARRRALAGEGTEIGSDFSESETHKVERTVAALCRETQGTVTPGSQEASETP